LDKTVEQRKGHDQDQIDLASDFLALVCREHVTLEQRLIFTFALFI